MPIKKWKLGQIFVAFTEYLNFTALTAQVAQNCFMNLKVDLSLYYFSWLFKALLSKLYNVLAIAVL
jgi:branched-subunit amino acid transport protein